MLEFLLILAVILFLSFPLFIFQRTVFPKDYNVVHHYTKNMLCDTDPVSPPPKKWVILFWLVAGQTHLARISIFFLPSHSLILNFF